MKNIAVDLPTINKHTGYFTGFALWLFFASLVPVFAQEAEEDALFSDPMSVETEILSTDDFDSLFGQDEIIQDSSDNGSEDGNPHDDLLVSDGIELGGNLRGSMAAEWFWSTGSDDYSFLNPTSQSLTPAVGADLFFDARPEPEFRVFGKFKIDAATAGRFDLDNLSFSTDSIDESLLPVGWTAEENANGDIEIRDSNGILILTLPAGIGIGTDDDTGTGVAPWLNLNVFELFADFAYKEMIFFRFGKHTVHWGLGYFFSPADVLNITSIDPEDPTVDREGPISLRTHYPFGVTGNAYLYLIANDQVEPLDIAIAPKVEFVIGTGELGVGAYFQRNLSPRLLAFYSISFGDVDLFAEAVLLYGSDRVFVRPSRNQSAAESDPDDALDLVLDTYEIDNAIFAEASVGARYFKQWEDILSLLVVGQYFFNGDGYDDVVEGILPAATRLMLFPGENGLAFDPDEQPEGYKEPPALSPADLSDWGRHYAAATVTAAELFGTDLSASLYTLVNISDFSGVIGPSISYSFLDRFSVSLAARFSFGDKDDQLTDPTAILIGNESAPTYAITLTLSMPGGQF